jgi:hypothetical protein
MAIKMKKEQILKIHPDLGREAAGIGTPRACNCAQVVQE